MARAVVRVSLVFPAVDDGGGLGALEPGAFGALLERRRRLTAADIAEARALWRWDAERLTLVAA